VCETFTTSPPPPEAVKHVLALRGRETVQGTLIARRIASCNAVPWPLWQIAPPCEVGTLEAKLTDRRVSLPLSPMRYGGYNPLDRSRARLIEGS